MSTSPQLPFFVYGTLLPGQPNYRLWAGAIRSERAAFLRNSRLYDMALLNLGHYPMLVEEQGEQVVGTLVEVEPVYYDAVLKRLDLLEDYRPGQPDESYYRRVKRIVTLTNGWQAVAWVYLGRAAVIAGIEAIPCGNWKVYCAARKDEVSNGGGWT